MMECNFGDWWKADAKLGKDASKCNADKVFNKKVETRKFLSERVDEISEYIKFHRSRIEIAELDIKSLWEKKCRQDELRNSLLDSLESLIKTKDHFIKTLEAL